MRLIGIIIVIIIDMIIVDLRLINLYNIRFSKKEYKLSTEHSKSSKDKAKMPIDGFTNIANKESGNKCSNVDTNIENGEALVPQHTVRGVQHSHQYRYVRLQQPTPHHNQQQSTVESFYSIHHQYEMAHHLYETTHPNSILLSNSC